MPLIHEIAHVNAQLLHLVAAVMPTSGERHCGIRTGDHHTILVGQSNVEKPPAVGIAAPIQFLNAGKWKSLMAKHLHPPLRQVITALRKAPILL